MIEWQGDLWTGLKRGVDAICVTTNGIVKSNGALVMGAGVAKQARDRFEGLDIVAGALVKEHGNNVQILRKIGPTHIVAFPTKAHFKDPSPIELIEKSAGQLQFLADKMSWKKVLLTRPGCGHGGLDWDYVKHFLEFYMDDRFIIVSP